jgi:hypothetical protein
MQGMHDKHEILSNPGDGSVNDGTIMPHWQVIVPLTFGDVSEMCFKFRVGHT